MKLPASKDIIFVTIQLLLFILYFFPLVEWSFNVHRFIGWASLTFAGLGLLIIIIAMLQLNTHLTPFPTPRESGVLINSGLYGLVRHPIYTGIILASIGFGIYSGSLWQVGMGLILWILFYFKSGYEESLLTLHYKDYKAYRETTGRFFPYI